MTMLKKLFFAPFFIILYGFLVYKLSFVLGSYNLIFSLSGDSLIQLIILSSLFCTTSLFFVVFSAISNDWKIFLPVAVVASVLPMILLNQQQGLILSVANLSAFTITSITLGNRLKSYLTFNASSLLSPSIKSLSTFLILVFSFVYFLSINQLIQTSGFQIPDSLINTTLKFMPQTDLGETSNIPSIPQSQLNMLKNNPQLLKQSGLDPKILDSLNQPNKSLQKSSSSINDLLKNTVKDQFQSFLKPYLTFMPAVLSVLLFLTLQSLTSIVQLIVYPLLWLIFLILEKTGFIKFEIEQRPVKKMVV